MQLNNVFRDWLKASKISEAVQTEFGLSFTSDIVIPIYDLDGNFIYNKYRRSPLQNTKPKYWYDKGAKISIYAWHKAKDHKSILITEGEKDCLVAWSHNIPAITSTGGALSFQEEWTTLLKDKDVTVCLDNDSSGVEGMVKILKFVPQAKIMLLPDRANVKDISDYVSSGGDLHELLKTAKHFGSLSEVYDDRSERLALWKSVAFHDAYIHANTRVSSNTKRKAFSSDEISNARLYPITNLLNLRSKQMLCPFHKEKTPSFHYYEETNTCYCFGGCGKAYDAIDIYKHIHKCSFKKAVDELNKLQ